MATLKEPLVTLALIVTMLLFDLKPGRFRFLLPSVPESSHNFCTSMKGMEIKRCFFFLFYHAGKGHLAYDMLSLFWKGMLVEGCIGSRQFASMVFTLLVTCDGLLVMAGVVWQFLGAAGLCRFGFSGLHFALSFILNSNREMYGFIIPYPSHNLHSVIVPANYAVDLALVYFLCPGLPFSSPVCGTLAGLLYSRGPQLVSSCNSWLLLNRRWFCPLPKVNRGNDPEQFTENNANMAWTCHACTYDNSVEVNPYICAICETPKFEFVGSSEMQVNPVNAGLVWNCPACTFENGVFLHDCEICGTPRPLSD
eukprot:Gb_37669 [translate_table: standard]